MSPDVGQAPQEGQVQKRFCIHCGSEMPVGGKFCPTCGKAQVIGPTTASPSYAPPIYPTTDEGASLRDFGRSLGALGTILWVILLAINLFVCLWGIGQIFPHTEAVFGLFVIFPFVVELFNITGYAFVGFYVFVSLAITASYLWMMRKSARTMKEELTGKNPKQGHSPAYVIGTLFMAVLAFQIIYYLILGTFVSVTSPIGPSTPLWALLFDYAEASVWEEVITRILLLGIPLLIVDMLLNISNPDNKMKKLWRYVLGGNFTIGKKEAVFLVISSLVFGLAHDPSWGPTRSSRPPSRVLRWDMCS